MISLAIVITKPYRSLARLPTNIIKKNIMNIINIVHKHPNTFFVKPYSCITISPINKTTRLQAAPKMRTYSPKGSSITRILLKSTAAKVPIIYGTQQYAL